MCWPTNAPAAPQGSDFFFLPESFGVSRHPLFWTISTRLAPCFSRERRLPTAWITTAPYIVAPIGASGIAFLGDANKFVFLEKSGSEQLSDRDGAVHAMVRFAHFE